MPELQTLFELFRERPAIFAGTVTLESISAFLAGYSFACDQNGPAKSNDPFIVPREFNDWVAYRLHFYESTSGFGRMISDRTDSESVAIEMFFDLLDAYRSRHERLVAKLSGINKTYKHVNKNGEQIRHYPDAVSLVVYTSDPGFFVISNSEQELPFGAFFPTMESFEQRFGVGRTALEILDANWIHPPNNDA